MCSRNTSSITNTLPTVAAKIAFVLLSDAPSTLPTKSEGFLSTTRTSKCYDDTHLKNEQVNAPSPLLKRPRSAKTRP